MVSPNVCSFRNCVRLSLCFMWWLYDAVVSSYFVIELVGVILVFVGVELVFVGVEVVLVGVKVVLVSVVSIFGGIVIEAEVVRYGGISEVRWVCDVAVRGKISDVFESFNFQNFLKHSLFETFNFRNIYVSNHLIFVTSSDTLIYMYSLCFLTVLHMHCNIWSIFFIHCCPLFPILQMCAALILPTQNF